MGVGNGTDICEGKIRQRHVRIAKSAFGPVSGVNFTTNTQNFSQKGTNNIQIAPNILVQMQNDPDKRVEYEALIYDCAQLVYSGKMSQGGMGYHIKAAGTVINAGWQCQWLVNCGR